jgi:Flp pilus assembly protein TadG
MAAGFITPKGGFMGNMRRQSLFGVFRQKQGSIALEFAIIIPVFFLLVFGIVDFGHAWYMRQIISNASREGARYGTRYSSVGGTRVIPNTLNPSISSYLTSKYSSILPSDANMQVTPGGTGYTSGNTGDDLSVKVDATKHWWVVGHLVPGIGSTTTLSSTTWMKVE